MVKKLFLLSLTVILSVSMVFGGMTCLAEELVEYEALPGGDMEWHGTSYAPWTIGTISTEIKNSGDKSIYITTSESTSTRIQQDYWTYLEPGKTFTLSFWLYRDGDFTDTAAGRTAAAGVYVSYKKGDTFVGESERLDKYVPDNPNTWQKYGDFTFTTPTNVDYDTVRVFITSEGVGTMYFDDVSIKGTCTSAEYAEKEAMYQRMQEGYEKSQYFYNESINKANSVQLSGNNLLSELNPGFETLTYNSSISQYVLADWKYPNNNTVSRDTSDKNSGSASLKLSIPDNYTGNKPHVYQSIQNTSFVDNAQYIVSGWVKTVNAPTGGGAQCDLKLYNSSDVSGTYFSQDGPVINTNGEWQEFKFVFTVPENIHSLLLYLRGTSVSTGVTVYYDDIKFGLASESNPILLNTKHTFNYVDEGDIVANVKFNTGVAQIESGSKIKFSLSDENGTVVAEDEVTADENNEWLISSSIMTKEEKYILKAEYVDPSGNVSDKWVKTKNIYLYDRPQTLDTAGNILDGDIVNGEFVPNGKTITPFFVYRWLEGRNDEFADAGVTVVRPAETITEEFLDELHSNGLKALIQLYGTYPVGHPRNSLINTVNLIKDHPAVLAYMLMDEPSKQVSSTGILTYDEMLYYLEEGYRQIREIDKIHPVFVMEASGAVADAYERASQMCDIFGIDPYPSGVSNAISGQMASKTQHAKTVVSEERPVWTLGFAADGWGGGDYGSPENYGSAMLRYQLYDALWAGANGAGHYVRGDHTMTDGTSYLDIYLDTFQAAEASGEIDEIFDHFTLDKPVFNEGSGNGYQWRAWYNDNGDMLVAVRSKISNSGTVLDTVTPTFDLVSSDGNTSIDGFAATLVNGTSASTVTSSTNAFTCTITAGEVSLYKIKKGYTLSNLEASSADTSVTVEYDVIKNLTDGGTVIYAFYDAQGRFVKMKTDTAVFSGGTTTDFTKTFNEKIDFASMKVFIWNSVTGMTPLSNMIEFIKE